MGTDKEQILLTFADEEQEATLRRVYEVLRDPAHRMEPWHVTVTFNRWLLQIAAERAKEIAATLPPVK